MPSRHVCMLMLSVCNCVFVTGIVTVLMLMLVFVTRLSVSIAGFVTSRVRLLALLCF